MKKLLITPTLLLVMAVLGYGDSYGNRNVCHLHYVYDGDSLTVDLCDADPLLGQKIGIRVNGIDTPEKARASDKEEAAGKKVADYVASIIQADSEIVLVDVDRDKYFRIVGTVYVNGMNLGDHLIQKGYAKPYDGGKKSPWTDEELDYILEN